MYVHMCVILLSLTFIYIITWSSCSNLLLLMIPGSTLNVMWFDFIMFSGSYGGAHFVPFPLKLNMLSKYL